MSYYPVVGDICRYEGEEVEFFYLIMKINEGSYREMRVHLLCLNSGEHFPDYIWHIDNVYWQKVA